MAFARVVGELTMARRTFRYSMAAWVLGAFAACGTYAGNPDSSDEGGPIGGPPPTHTDKDPVQRIRVAIADAAIDDVANLYVSFARVAVSADGESWVDLPVSYGTGIDVAALRNGASLLLASLEELPPADYKHILIELAPAHPVRLVRTDGTEEILPVPHEYDGGLSVLADFTPIEGDGIQVTLDFDLRKSVVLNETGTLELQPTFRAVNERDARTLEGEAAQAGEVVCVYPKGAKKNTDDSCWDAVTSAVVGADGKFVVSFLPPGEYELRMFSPELGTYADVVEQVAVGSEKKTKIPKVRTIDPQQQVKEKKEKKNDQDKPKKEDKEPKKEDKEPKKEDKDKNDPAKDDPQDPKDAEKDQKKDDEVPGHKDSGKEKGGEKKR